MGMSISLHTSQDKELKIKLRTLDMTATKFPVLQITAYESDSVGSFQEVTIFPTMEQLIDLRNKVDAYIEESLIKDTEETVNG